MCFTHWDSNNLYKYDLLMKKVKLVKHHEFDFVNSFSHQIGSALYVVKGKPLSVIVYSNVARVNGKSGKWIERVDKTVLRMGCERRVGFATAMHKNVSIYISGGCIESIETNHSMKFDLKTN